MKQPALVLTLLVVCAAAGLQAEQFAITLVGSAQPNCWDVEDIVAGVTRGAGSDREKALALHHFGMAHFVHFNGPIEERGEYVTDPVKLIGVYGFALCGNNSAAMTALYNAAGLKTRTRSMPGHAVPEVWFEGKWNYIDTDMFGYVFLPDGYKITSVDELSKDADLFMKQANPPNPYYPFDKKEDMASVFRGTVPTKNYHPYPNAHMMNLALRAGESATLYYRPRNRYLLSQLQKDLGIVYKNYWTLGPVRRGSLAWCDRPPAAYSNGVIEYEPDLPSEAFRLENPDWDGIAVRHDRQSPPLTAAGENQLASLVVKVNSPWVIVGLQNDLTNFDDDSDAAVVSGLFWQTDSTDENRILVSTDAGRSWKQVWENRHFGAVPFQVDLTRHVNGHYTYWVKFEWLDKKGTGKVGLERLKLKTWVELSPMALPRLNPGKNTFRLSTAPRRTFYNESWWQRGRGLPGQRLENLTFGSEAPYVRPQEADRPGVLTFRLGPKGLVEEARVSVLARAYSEYKPTDASVRLSLSEDDAKTWQELEHFTPNPEHQRVKMWFNHIIKNKTLNGEQCWLRVSVSGAGLEKVIANSAIRAEPKAPSALRITHTWREGEQQKTFTQSFPPGLDRNSYEIEAPKAGLMNEALRIEAIAID